MISVIVPAYNVEKSLSKCVDSVLNQTIRDFELIIVNDGSTDKTLEIANDYAKRDNRVKVINKENTGANFSRKVGFENSVGDYISFVDADDYLEPGYLETLYLAFEKDIDIVVCSYFIEYEKSTKKIIFENEVFHKEDLLTSFILPSICYIKSKDKYSFPKYDWMRMYRRELIKDDFFISQKKYFAEDTFSQLYTLVRSKSVKVLNKPLYHYVVFDDSLTNKYTRDLFKKLKLKNQYIFKFCMENNIVLEEERKYYLMINSILDSIRNGARSNIFDFKTECSEIDKYRKEIIFNKLNDYSKKDKILLFLLKYKLINLLYGILRINR